MAFSFLLITACHRLELQKAENLAMPAECRVVQHKFGEACIPLQPQRIVVLDPYSVLDPLLSLNIRPVGTTIIEWGGRKYFTGLTTDEVQGIEIIGTTQQPSLERVHMLKPDLILFAEWQEHIYEIISKIAPAIPDERNKFKLSFKDHFRAVAQLVGQEKKADEVLKQYQKRVEEVRKVLGNQLENLEISVIMHDRDFYLPPNHAGFFQVLTDIGLHLKPVFLTQKEWSGISIETINEYDADILFIVNLANQPPSYFFQNPLIASLKSVKNNRAYVVDSTIWEAYGPLGMNKLLDELPQYLLEGT